MTLVSELFSKANITVQRWSSKPDHSMLSWKFNLRSYTRDDPRKLAIPKTLFTRFDTSMKPVDFLAGKFGD